MSKKHLVASGCSFTISDGEKIGTNNRSWAYGLRDSLPEDSLNLHNVGISGGGNVTISMNCINCVENLLKDNIKAEEIVVFIQWSGLFRPTLYAEKNGSRKIDFEEPTSPYFSLNKINQDRGYFIDTAGQFTGGNKFWHNYFQNYFSLPSAFNETLNSILKTQWYLKSKNIKYKMFTGWDIFTGRVNISEESCAYDDVSINMLVADLMLNTHQFHSDIYENKNHVFIKDIYPYFIDLWDMVDWENFWTFENEKVKCGGILQWVQNNKSFDDWYVNYGHDFHIPSHSNKSFAEEIIKPLYEKLIQS
jgi:hypothetical protein